MNEVNISDEIRKASEVLKKGGVILYPTDTIWGLGCDATRIKSVERIFNIKKRPESKGFIVLLDQFENSMILSSPSRLSRPT
jgi:L-threonylcarbamoyladenylate synthase